MDTVVTPSNENLLDFENDNLESGPETRTDPNDESCWCFPKVCCDPGSRLHRYIVLVFMCFLGFGSYYCYDNPGALQEQIIHDLDISVGSYTQLYSWYSWPNTILCFFGGFLIDRVFGIRLGAIIFAAVIFVGQLVFAAGAFFNQFWLMIFGRFIFGIGGESLAVAQNTYAVSWFKDKELNMVFGLQLSVARAGSTANFNTMVTVYKEVQKHFTGYQCLGVALFIAAGTCLFSMACALILAYFDKRAARILGRDAGTVDEKVNITDAKDFGWSFWLISMICVTYYVTIFPFTALGGMFFQRKFKISQNEADFYCSIIYVISVFASPVLGFMVDLTGRNLLWILIATLITLASHSMLAFTFIHPLVGMVVMGIGYSVLACALWPMVSFVIPKHQLGTAYGIMQSLQNLGLGCVVLAAGHIVDAFGYICLEIFFLAWLCFCLIMLIGLYLVDKKTTGGMLNMSMAQRRLYQEQKQQALTEPEFGPSFEAESSSSINNSQEDKKRS